MGLLWDTKNDNSNDSGLNDIKKMVMLSQLDPTTALGYKLGQFISNKVSSGQDRSANDALNKLSQPANSTANSDGLNNQIAQVIGQNVLNSDPSYRDSMNSFIRMDPSHKSPTGTDLTNSAKLLNGIGQQTAADATKQSAWDQMAAQYGDVSKNALNGTTSNPANTGGVNALSAIGGINSISNIADGNGSVSDIFKLGKLAGFFDGAASANGSAGAASKNVSPVEQAVQESVQQMASQETIPQQTIADQSVSESQSNVGSNQATPQNTGPASSLTWDQLAAQNGDISRSGLLAGLTGQTTGNTNNGQQKQPATQSTAMNLAADKIRADILNTKMAYQIAQTNGDQAGMQQAHDRAEEIRSAAQRYGISLDDFGEGNTLQEATQRKNIDDYAAQIKQIVNPDVSSEEYYTQVYNKLRDMGYGDDTSKRVASQKTQQYHAQRITDLSNRFSQQGLSQTGAVNNVGAQILLNLANENPTAYEAISKMYAMPRDDYNFNNAIKQAVIGEGLNKDLSQFNSGLRKGEAQFNSGLKMQEADHNLANTVTLKQIESKLNVAQRQAFAQIDLQTQGLSMQQRYSIMFKLGKQSGLNDQDAATYALPLATGKSSGGSNKAMSQQTNAQLSAAKAIIADHDNFMKNNMDPKATYPNEEQYQQAIKLYSSILSGNQGNSSSGQSYNLNNYDDAMKDATDVLSAATQRGGYSKQQLIAGFKKRYGDMADSIIDDIDWSQWGY